MNRFAQRIEELTDPDVEEINERENHSQSESELQRLEQELGISLPADYREFMRDFGGFWLRDNVCRRAAIYHLHDNVWGTASITSFYTADELLEHAKYQWEQSYIPRELLEVGESGNVRFYLAVAGIWKGTFYQWYPNSFPERLYYYPDLELIARSFSDFLQMLRPVEGEMYVQTAEQIQEVAQIRSRLEAITLTPGNLYTPKMASLNARYVYCTLGEDAPHLTEAGLKALEKEIGFSFPADYREFLRDFNGYSFLPVQRSDGYYGVFPRISHSGPNLRTHFSPLYSMRFFHACIRDDLHSFGDHNERLRNILPQGIIPIANGGEICLSASGEDIGTVHVAGEDVSGRQQEPTASNGKTC